MSTKEEGQRRVGRPSREAIAAEFGTQASRTGLSPRANKLLQIIRESIDRQGYPPSVREMAVATASIVALLPGLAVYRAINLFLADNPAVVGQAVLQFGTAVSTGLALAAGLSIGGFLARRRFGLDLASRRARRRARGTHVSG